MINFQEFHDNYELNKMLFIRGCHWVANPEKFNTKVTWISDSNNMYTSRYIGSQEQVVNLVQHARMEILLGFPYTNPTQCEYQQWYVKSSILRTYINSEDINPMIALHSLFNGPTSSFIEILLVKMGEI